MSCCLRAPGHYADQCWPISSELQWDSPEGNFRGCTSTTIGLKEKQFGKISFKCSRTPWVKPQHNDDQRTHPFPPEVAPNLTNEDLTMHALGGFCRSSLPFNWRSGFEWCDISVSKLQINYRACYHHIKSWLGSQCSLAMAYKRDFILSYIAKSLVNSQHYSREFFTVWSGV